MKIPPHPRFLAFLAVLVAATGLLARRDGLALALVWGFDAAALVFLVSTLALWAETVGQASRDRAARDDGGRGFLLLIAIITPLVVLTALLLLIQSRDHPSVADLALMVGTLALAWIFVNLVYALHYDHLFHVQTGGADTGGLEFPGTKDPVFADFCYFAFTLGMTCQTSDVAVLTSDLRRVVLVQGLLSFVFNLGVLAMAINLMAGVL